METGSVNISKIKWVWVWWKYANVHWNGCNDLGCEFCKHIEKFKKEFVSGVKKSGNKK